MPDRRHHNVHQVGQPPSAQHAALDVRYLVLATQRVVAEGGQVQPCECGGVGEIAGVCVPPHLGL